MEVSWEASGVRGKALLLSRKRLSATYAVGSSNQSNPSRFPKPARPLRFTHSAREPACGKIPRCYKQPAPQSLAPSPPGRRGRAGFGSFRTNLEPKITPGGGTRARPDAPAEEDPCDPCTSSARP